MFPGSIAQDAVSQERAGYYFPAYISRVGGNSLLRRLFGKGSAAMVFVDYEYWFYTYKNSVGIRPDPQSFRNALNKEFDVSDIMVFGDFSSQELGAELRSLRSITNTIIETGNTFFQRKKDMTDFVMLDYIYRCEDDNKNIGTYIIFSGDGHFQSVIRHLVQRKKKRVIVYGIKDSVSNQLADVASEVRYLPVNTELKYAIYRMIASNMAYIKDKPQVIPTFNSTIDIISGRKGINRESVRECVSDMMQRGYLYQKNVPMNEGRVVKVLEADWDLLARDGIWIMNE